jgi:phosphoglycolate phosphatase-like HAD superfamily hydrolase
MIRNFIFDIDGTLLDSKRDIAQAQLFALKELGITHFTAEDIYPNIGKPLMETFSILLPKELHPQIPAVALVYRKHYLAHAYDTTCLFPGVKDVIVNLHENGFRLGVATTKSTETTMTMLEYFGVARYFEQIQGTDQMPCKPDPFIINKIIDEQQWDRTVTVMVGDTDKDVLAAQNAGIRSCAVTYGSFTREKIAALMPTWIIDKFPELLSLVNGV